MVKGEMMFSFPPLNVIKCISQDMLFLYSKIAFKVHCGVSWEYTKKNGDK